MQTWFGLAEVVEVWEYERGLLYEKGRFIKQLEPGRYHLWRWQYRAIEKISQRQVSQTIGGQEVLTTDKVPVRVTLIAQYSVSDPVLALHAVEDYTERLYQDLQLSLRTAISTRSVDELLADRDALSTSLGDTVATQAATYGITLHRVGVKDIVLPGSVQRVFLQEVEADRAGRAALVAARHETAAARTKANTAKIMHENPLIMRLQELETLIQMADKEGNVLIIPGIENLLARRQD
ncbi:MAG: slipin family protein [Anaerolineae bacterium]|nr:slipin family protein [Anaerolineae bacterium]